MSLWLSQAFCLWQDQACEFILRNLCHLQENTLISCTCSILGPTNHYAVYCTENSIVSRTYFFATLTMEDSSVAYIHHCVKNRLANDPGRRMATLLLRRLVAFYYHTLVLNFPISERGKYKSHSYITPN
jgi:hypothetical protein